ncbi:MAG: transposase family protein [Gammaproteobacteria bacterium]|nr:transposase family protein [Gammaproteobacteria bacterium]
MHVPIRSGYPLQTLSLNFISGLNTCADATRYMLTVQDGWSHFCKLYPIKEAKAANVIHVLPDSFIAVFGCADEIRTDRGPQFTSDAFTQWTESFGIRKVKIPVNNPHSNKVERLHRTVQSMLCSTMGDWVWTIDCIIPNLQKLTEMDRTVHHHREAQSSPYRIGSDHIPPRIFMVM